MSDKKIKVSGYSQRIFYNNGIEYRPFSSNLVGLQSTSLNDSATFTMGNFNVSANTETKVSKFFNTNRFSNFYDLTNLGIDLIDVETFLNRKKLSLKLRRNNLKNFAYFGSIKEYLRVSLENIILEWPAGMISSPMDYDNPGDINYSFYNLVYDVINDISEFEIKKSLILNPFNINLTQNNVFKDINPLRDFTINYYSYEVVGLSKKFNIIYFEDLVGTIKIRVKGNINGELTNNTRFTIKPNNQSIEKFFKRLNNFEGYLLNRGSQPKFTASFDVNYINEFGVTIESQREVTWPITDGYNIAFDNQEYSDYVTELIEITEVSDTFDTDIMSRSLVANSILEFDTIPNVIGDNEVKEGQKINSLLKVYGRSFDEVKQYIDGISFAHVVTYDQEDNTPDEVLKILANTMGWDLFSTFKSESYIQDFLESNGNTFTGNNLELTNIEEEYEIWRRLILNTPWLWKSKGTRKGIEFLIKFLGIPDGLILFNEHIYRVSEKLDVGLINNILDTMSGNTTSFYELPITEDGYPKISPNTDDMYFQKAGLWYRETGGPNANIEIYSGNNPHIGKYDGGQEYVNQFKSIIPNFEPITIINEMVVDVVDNLFINNDSGSFNLINPNEPSVEILDGNNLDLADYVIFNAYVDTINPDVAEILNDCGCLDTSYNGSLFINVKPNKVVRECDYSGFSFGVDGLIEFTINGNSTQIIEAECCTALGFNPQLTNAGFICRWKEIQEILICNGLIPLKEGDGSWLFIDGLGETTTIVPSAECCPTNSNPRLVDGGYECDLPIIINPNSCGDLVLTDQTIDGFVVFNLFNDSTIYVPTIECCTVLGFDSIRNQGGISCVRCKPYQSYFSENGTAVFYNSVGDTFIEVNSPECCPSKFEGLPIIGENGTNSFICVNFIKEPIKRCRYLNSISINDSGDLSRAVAIYGTYCDGRPLEVQFDATNPGILAVLIEDCVVERTLVYSSNEPVIISYTWEDSVSCESLGRLASITPKVINDGNCDNSMSVECYISGEGVDILIGQFVYDKISGEPVTPGFYRLELNNIAMGTPKGYLIGPNGVILSKVNINCI